MVAHDPNDFDEDGVANADDNCPLVTNPGQEYLNFNGIGDVCEDTTSLDTTAFLHAFDGTTGADATDPDAGEPPWLTNHRLCAVGPGSPAARDATRCRTGSRISFRGSKEQQRQGHLGSAAGSYSLDLRPLGAA